MTRYTRNNAMFASTLFRNALYHPDESQILTCGSDRKLTYWDAFDGRNSLWRMFAFFIPRVELGKCEFVIRLFASIYMSYLFCFLGYLFT